MGSTLILLELVHFLRMSSKALREAPPQKKEKKKKKKKVLFGKDFPN